MIFAMLYYSFDLERGDDFMTQSTGGGTLTLRGEYITLAHAIKAVGLADTGGQAKLLVREGQVLVNGELATQPGRKLRAGDRFGMTGGPEWTISS
jgi:ribosome-associated protein